MRTVILFCITTLLSVVTLAGAVDAEDQPTIINLMISTDMPPSASEDVAYAAEIKLKSMYDSINSRGLVATIFATQDFIDTHARLLLTRIGLESGFELGMSGKHSDEKISELSYQDQKMLLETSKHYVEACKICGVNEIIVRSFLPQSFDQNKVTYELLDYLGIKYNAGYKAGLLYEPGHEDDVWPYPVKGHDFYAVPVSTYLLSGKKVVLHDKYFSENGMNASQWYDALISKFEEIQGKDEPMVLLLTTSISGSGDYFDALNRFLDYAKSKNAIFVTTAQLGKMARYNVRDVSALPADETAEECPTCEESKTESGINATIRVTNINQTAINQSAAATTTNTTQ